MNPVFWTLLSWAGVMMALFFAVVWAISVKIKNYGLLDVAWSYGVAILAPFYAWNATGDPWRKWLITAVGILWSLRLGTYILLRVIRHHPSEDQRYQTLRKQWPGPGMFLLFFEFQALLVVIFSLPFLLVACHPGSGLQVVEWIGLGLAILAIAGEWLSDRQMQIFKSRSSDRTEVCRVGFWRYSRHPNYFFESLVWCGFALFALGSPWGWIALICPVLILWFLFKVTGIPLTEEYALKTKGAKYRHYQQTTSVFIPWPPKKV